ncbi:hypothetical protein [Fimbriiglobus ruber]|uniref:hypothetical protein n=1 Tax=Fimbriiglobus ruber TaxID=1908690 RepID=UPI00117A6609|nr:hypothetical protein [Fimbriiglobus ruber]
MAIYRAAGRARDDGRLRDAGRTVRVEGLEQRVYDLCSPQWLADEPPGEGCRNEYRLLVNELMRLSLAEELFPFVTAPAVTQPNGTTTPVAGTNNEAERTLRGSADARKTGRTSKTPADNPDACAACAGIIAVILDGIYVGECDRRGESVAGGRANLL